MYFTGEKNLLHFMYILPFSHNNALVESTVFSKDIFNNSWYREKIYKYLNEKNIIEFKEIGEEKGIIPMFMAAEKNSSSPKVFNIGIRGCM